MLTNFYVVLDGVDIHGSSFSEMIDAALAYASTAGGLLTAHWLNASILLLSSAVLLMVGIVRKRTWLWSHALVLVLAIVAGAFGGAAFIAYKSDLFSFLMALAFPVAFAAALSLSWRTFR